MAEVKTNEGKKFTEEEMKNISLIKEDYNRITIKLGQIEMDRILLDEQRDDLNKKYFEVREKEIKYAKELSSKYGEGSLDLDTGVFIPQ